jgi:hypothetical protein
MSAHNSLGTAPPVKAVHDPCSSKKAWKREIRLSAFKSSVLAEV